MPTELKPYVRMRRCPKCMFFPATTVYRAGYHWSGGVYGPELDTCRHPLAQAARSAEMKAWSDSPYHRVVNKPTPAELEAYELGPAKAAFDAKAAVGEHFERVCPNCKYEWAEGVEPDA